VADVFLTVSEPERRPLRFVLLAGFFPLITGGPIERSEEALDPIGVSRCP